MTSQVVIRRRASSSGHAIFSQLPEPLARVYASRGITDQAQLGRHLAELLPDNQLKDIELAAGRIADAIEQQQSILIVGDFDCDGATSTALAVLGLRGLGGQQVNYLVPDRFRFGYGLSPELVEFASANSPQLIITVDNGISSLEGVDKAAQLGIDVVVTDHHLAGEQLPKAVAIVNPNQPACSFAAKSTCGVGVMFYVLIAVRRELLQRDWFTRQNLAAANLAELLDLVALGTVADVVPLEQNNRALVFQGIKRIRAGRARPGLLALIEVAGRRREKLVASDLGFAIAPRLNAAGRLEDMSIGIECLLTDHPERARELAQQLDQLNVERRAIEREMQQQAVGYLDELSEQLQGASGVSLFDERWHQGVIGILASRIKERTFRPTIAFAPGEGGEVKGSGRSIPGFHMRDGLALINTQNPGLIKKFGGHAMAAGLTLDAENLPAFNSAFAKLVADSMQGDDLTRVLETDGQLSGAEFNLELAQLFREAGPWGHQFPEPLFDNQFEILQQRLVGKQHLKLVLMEPLSGVAVDAIQFNIDTAQWPNEGISRVRVVYKLDINEFRGQRSVQLLIEHLEPV